LSHEWNCHLLPSLLLLFGSLPAHESQRRCPIGEEIWKSLEQVPSGEREKRLVEGAKAEGEMMWYTNSGMENATRYIQAFKKQYPFIKANFWRSKTRQVTQRVIAEASLEQNHKYYKEGIQILDEILLKRKSSNL
jgi:iron(III) transport system substrate-binding protein